jgi:cytochrome c551/c552
MNMLYALREAMSQPGCPICQLRDDAALRFIDNLLWESVNDPAARDVIRRARGFCHQHAWDLVRNGATLGSTIIMRDVLNDVLRTAQGAHFESPPALSLRRTREMLDRAQPSTATANLVAALAPQAACPACVQAEKMEGLYVETLVDNLTKEEGLLATLQESDGLCLPHLRQALVRVRDEGTYAALMEVQETIWERLVSQLDEVIRKSDYRFRHEAWGEERGSCKRSIASVAGRQKGESG